MEYLALGLATPEQNLAADEALLLEADEGRRAEVVRTWESEQLAVVLGASRPARDDVDLAACADRGVPVVRRCSGGGTVLLGPGCLSYAVVLDHRRPELAGGIRAVDAWVLDALAGALAPVVGPIQRLGGSDLVLAERKFSGNAQRRRRSHTLYHGTLLYGFDLELLERLLPFPDRTPEYRGTRPHGDFVGNLPIERDELVDCVKRAFRATGSAQPPDLELVERLVREQYGRAEWTHRR